MKQMLLKAALAVTLMFSLQSYSQGPDAEINTEFATKMNAAFSQLEKNRVPNKLLLDYTMEFTHLPAYNGVITTENAVHVGSYKSIYNTLLMAQIQQGVPGMYTPAQFKSRWDLKRSASHIALSGLYYKYSKFKDDAIITNKLSVVNGKFIDKYINGLWQNPYEEKAVFAVAAPVMTINSRSFTVSLPSTLFYTNQSSSISSIAVDFGKGAGYENMTYDMNKSLSYSANGIYTWKFRLTLTNGQILYSHTKIRIVSVAVPQPLTSLPCKTCPIPPLNNKSEPLQGTLNFDMPTSVTASKPYQGISGSATLQIRYALGDGVIRRPLIVAEGFDPALLEPENPLGMTSLATFMQSINGDTGGLPAALSTYDIIYVNWNNGLDFIQRNAFLLEEIITLVNQHKTTSEKNIVMGQSMGGLVARYALRDMENTSVIHDTRLFISHDSPHLGANIPISYQHLDRHVYNQFIQSPLLEGLVVAVADDAAVLYDVQTMFDAPATRQMLINYVKGNHAIDNSWHIAWQNELTNMGYPAQTRNVAISNGSHCGTLQDFAPGSRLFSLSGNIRTGWLADLVLTAFPLANAILWGGVAAITFEPPFLLGILPGNNKITINFWANALPASGIQQIYKGQITYTKKLLWAIDITVNITNKDKSSPAGVLPYDSYPGGFYNIPMDFEDVSYSNLFVEMNITGDLTNTFDFIPTPSALDVGKGLVALNNTDHLAAYTAAAPPAAPKDIPFANFITAYDVVSGTPSSANTRHITFNEANGNWLVSELDTNTSNNIIYDCTKFCAGTEITGNWLLCTTQTYSVTSQATTASWWISEGNNLVTLATNGITATLTRAVSNVSGYVTLNVSYSNATCGTATASKRVYMGRPALVNTTITGGYDNIAFYDETQFNVTAATKATSYRWTISGDFNCNGVPNAVPSTFYNEETIIVTTAPYVQVQWGNCPGYYTISCRAVNDCGFTAYTAKTIQLFQAGGGNDPCDRPSILKVYPNPVKGGSISARMIPYPGEPCDDEPLRPAPVHNQVKIYDMWGKQLYNRDFATDEIDINGLSLAKGQYILNVTTSKGHSNREVIIVE